MGNTAGLLQVGFYDSREPNSKSSEEIPLFTAGEQIRGYVSVDFGQVAKFFPGQNLDFMVKVGLEGKERSKIAIGAANRRAERVLVYEQKTLHQVTPSEVWTPHLHEFKFELEIPPQMPGSLRSSEGRKSYAELDYKVVAFLEGPKRSRRSLLTATSITRKIQIRAAPVPIIVVPFMMQPMSHEIKTFGLKRNGHLLFGAYVADTHVGPEETLEIAVGCKNYSTADIEEVYFRLVETISWLVDDTNQTKSDERVLVDRVEPLHIPAPKDLWYLNAIEGDIGHQEDGLVSLYHELKSRKTGFRVQVPPPGEISDDYAGPLVRCTHHLEIRIKTENHVDDPRVRIPLQLKQYTSFEETPNHAMSKAFSVVPQIEDAAAGMHSRYLTERTARDSLRNQIDGILEEHARESTSRLATSTSGDTRVSGTNSNPRRSDISFNSQALSEMAQESTNEPATQELAEEETRPPPLSILVSGGRVKDLGLSGESQSDMSSVGGASISIFPEEAAVPSFQALLDEMLVSVDDFDIVCAKLQDPEWQSIFFQLTPEEFGSMIAHVHMDHDQPKVAAVVAGQISWESKFTTEHLLSALQNACDWTRTSLIQQLLPFCSNFSESHSHLVEALTPWELMVLADDLEAALSPHAP